MKRFTLDKKIIKFILGNLDFYELAGQQISKEDSQKIVEAGILISAYLSQESTDKRDGRLGSMDTVIDLAEHCCRKLARKVDPELVGLNDRWRVISIIEKYKE